MSIINQYSFLGTDRGHIFQDADTQEKYLLVRATVLNDGRNQTAEYNLVNLRTGKARVSSIDRLFRKNPDLQVTAFELNQHFDMNLVPVEHISTARVLTKAMPRIKTAAERAIEAARDAASTALRNAGLGQYNINVVLAA